ncbi:hypothetical protein FR483_n319R [Paramecium bursaria Chlorella virus FR483]|uniref:Uncharacterized protein n319R n=1 Tax=Paramecium bursaria Chlorella virus FR483 TaxID=399781 RepID=A7J723_PBCVF|nr:hypothetical protein FR483_n319R [Paramecium bursaria Chlorella virus FR483]ABT15604.1 hypothetical protein FR483_n319R [Paramecium bursaria Chlorella virus FR483]
MQEVAFLYIRTYFYIKSSFSPQIVRDQMTQCPRLSNSCAISLTVIGKDVSGQTSLSTLIITNFLIFFHSGKAINKRMATAP